MLLEMLSETQFSLLRGFLTFFAPQLHFWGFVISPMLKPPFPFKLQITSQPCVSFWHLQDESRQCRIQALWREPRTVLVVGRQVLDERKMKTSDKQTCQLCQAFIPLKNRCLLKFSTSLFVQDSHSDLIWSWTTFQQSCSCAVGLPVTQFGNRNSQIDFQFLDQ